MAHFLRGQTPRFSVRWLVFWGVQMTSQKANLDRELAAVKARVSASEVHGFITGWCCSGTGWESATESFEEALEISLSGELKETALAVAHDAIAGLTDVDFGFEILLPDEADGINQRRTALSDWCQGFLSGFGLTGRYQDSELTDEVKELLQDFSQIAQVDDEIPENEENESDLTEITEYVRMGAVMVFTDCATKAVH